MDDSALGKVKHAGSNLGCESNLLNRANSMSGLGWVTSIAEIVTQIPIQAILYNQHHRRPRRALADEGHHVGVEFNFMHQVDFVDEVLVEVVPCVLWGNFHSNLHAAAGSL